MNSTKISRLLSHSILPALLLSLLIPAMPVRAVLPSVDQGSLLNSAFEYAKAGEHTKAAEAFNKILALGVELPDDFYLRYGYHLYRIHEFKDAKKNLEIYLKRTWPKEGYKFKYAIDLTVKIDNEIRRNRQYVKNNDRTVTDTETGLEWLVGPDQKTSWTEAKHWVASLNTAGGEWRMPTTQELESLFVKGLGTRNMTPYLKTTGWWVWSENIRDSSSAWAFFYNHNLTYWFARGGSDNSRAFAVRSRR